jgi:hypothetical protein
MAIDQDVRQTMDAYRGNPGALQKQYALDKDLIKLLALSKLKEEKDDAARQLTLSQQGQPGTIASQMGAEARERTVGEVTKQVSGVKAEQLKLQQRNMQQMAGGIPGARPGGPQGAGVAGQPAPNMARMAGGGIVSFAEGGVTDAQLERMKITRADFDSLTDAGKAMYLDKFAPIAKDASPLSQAFTDMGDYIDRNTVKNMLAQAAKTREGIGVSTGVSKLGEYIFGTPEGYDALTKKEDAANAEANRIQAFGRPPAAKKAPAAAVAPPASGIAAAAAAPAAAPASGYKDLDREGLAARYEKMRAARAGVAEKNAAERKDQGFYDLFAGLGGTGPGKGLSDIGARGTVMAENRRRQAMLDVAGDAGLDQKSIVQDLAMAGVDVRTAEGKQKAIFQLESKIADLELKWEKALSDALLGTTSSDRPAAIKAYNNRKRAALAGPKKALNKLLGIADSNLYAGFGTLSKDSKKSTS